MFPLSSEISCCSGENLTKEKPWLTTVRSATPFQASTHAPHYLSTHAQAAHGVQGALPFSIATTIFKKFSFVLLFFPFIKLFMNAINMIMNKVTHAYLEMIRTVCKHQVAYDRDWVQLQGCGS